MSFIIVNDKDEITITDDALVHPDIKRVYEADASENKKHFYKYINYIFWVYKPNGIYWNLLPENRKDIVIKRFYPNDDWRKIESSYGVKEMIDLYIQTSLTPNEVLYESCKKDIEYERKRLSEIPPTKKILYEGTHDIEVSAGKKNKIQTILVKEWLDIDNSDEKDKAYKRILLLFEYEEKMRTIVEKERIDKVTGKYQRVFDKRD